MEDGWMGYKGTDHALGSFIMWGRKQESYLHTWLLMSNTQWPRSVVRKIKMALCLRLLAVRLRVSLPCWKLVRMLERGLGESSLYSKHYFPAFSLYSLETPPQSWALRRTPGFSLVTGRATCISVFYLSAVCVGTWEQQLCAAAQRAATVGIFLFSSGPVMTLCWPLT